ncbi:Rv3235 family protein [Aeromicrobium wangtongii]|uniref:Rv3235 family protein n=1 Tax=Aeromicrobium wangtongii TaxID=2969247 RepID=A0ABY5MD23_9ACTN|nr:Rv3235 family protein [Aeromicrobium wangtongii]MCD9197078.1 Rv3235 family protein [Aeromicrobium wangtongii]MCL3818002.1 Rv3235 family protein [Aeromicrobium wangtongii]UUP14578.1 Rv3235 family protein [Aeromicrobium wangtongii]
MKTATTLLAPPPHVPFNDAVEPAAGQIALPFPGMTPVLPAPVERGDARPIRERSARFMQALVEVLSGERPVRQLAAWMAPDVYAQLTSRLSAHARVPLRARSGRGARIVSVHVAMVHDEAAEIAGRMVHRGRSRAIAVRLELQETHRGDKVWRCTALVWA